jgi:23S rRNA (uracil1939-C5)-methyltransferase
MRGGMPAPFAKGDVVLLRIEDLAFGGPGVARHEGLVVMVKGGLPGDLVRAAITKLARSHAEATTVEIVEASPQRVVPRCSHFGVCGGCRWQDLDYAAQLAWKKRQIVESLRRIGRFEDPEVEDPLPSPDVFFYRNKMEFSFGRGPDGGLILGLHPAASYEQVFDLRECHLESTLSNELIAFLRERCREAALPPYDVRTHQGFLRYLAIREGKMTGEIMVNLVTSEGESTVLREIARETAARFPAVVSFIRSVNSRRATVAVGEREEVLHGRSHITERIDGSEFEITASSFFQTNSRQAEQLYATALEAADLRSEDRVLDLYSGTGTISILAARTAAEVRGVESQPDSVKNAERNASINGARNCFFIRAEARKALASLASDRNPPTVIIVNPPRAGLNRSVIHHMLRLRPRRFVYVSCNPATLARDLNMICDRDYTLTRVRPVDMFPHTFHVECVVQVERTPGSRGGRALIEENSVEDRTPALGPSVRIGS